MIWKTEITEKVNKYISTVCQVTNIRQVFKFGDHHQGMKGEKKLLKNVGAKWNFEGRVELGGDPGEEGILRCYESDFSEKWNYSSEL